MLTYKRMDVGFTGSRYGMSPEQAHVTSHLLGRWASEMKGYDYFFHHGCCKGADRQAHDMARAVGFEVTAHPGPRNSWDDFDNIHKTEFFIIRDRKNFHPRNDDIVDESEVVIATPRAEGLNVEGRGGTHYTIRQAIKRHRTLYVILSHGEVYKWEEGKFVGKVILEDLNAQD